MTTGVEDTLGVSAGDSVGEESGFAVSSKVSALGLYFKIVSGLLSKIIRSIRVWENTYGEHGSRDARVTGESSIDHSARSSAGGQGEAAPGWGSSVGGTGAAEVPGSAANEASVLGTICGHFEVAAAGESLSVSSSRGGVRDGGSGGWG